MLIPFGKKILWNLYVRLDKLLISILSALRGLVQDTVTPRDKIKVKSLASPCDTEINDLAIIISTFEPRFDLFALPLIRQIRRVTTVPIYLVINGNYNGRKQDETIRTFLKSVVSFTNVYPIVFNKLQGCAKLWNTGIIHSESKHNLILNDDILIYEKGFLEDLLKVRRESEECGLVTINSTWSFFCISSSTIQRIGFFDERFLGIGEEDGDYIFRFESETGRLPKNLILSSFLNVKDDSRDISIAPGIGKYSLFNRCLRMKMYQENENGIFGPFQMKMIKSVPFSSPYPFFEFRDFFYSDLTEPDTEKIFERFQIGARFFDA